MIHPIQNQAHQLTEHINMLLESTSRLDDNLRDKLGKVSRKMSDFMTEFDNHLVLSAEEFTSYLNHDALSPLTIVLGYAELFRTIHAHLLTSQEIELINGICNMLRTLTESIRNERDFMVARRG